MVFVLRALVFAICVPLLVASSGVAGVIRHDRDDAFYTMMASNGLWNAVGQDIGFISPTRASLCSATLIHPQWVLCAAHCVDDGTKPPILNHEIRINGQTFTVGPQQIFVHESWFMVGRDFKKGFDIAMYRLSSPVLGIRPLPINTSRNEIGQVGFSVGYGMTGDGTTGQVLDAGTRRAGQNVIDTDGISLLNVQYGNTATLVYDFDNPWQSSSVVGSRVPLHAEYGIAQGDSGGPLMVFSSGGFRVAGICSAGVFPGRPAFGYGTASLFTRVSSYLPWIQSVMAGGVPAYPQMSNAINQNPNAVAAINRATALAKQEDAFLQRMGWTVAPAINAARTAHSEFVVSASVFARPRQGLLEIAEQTVRDAAAYQPMPQVECLTCATRQEETAGEVVGAEHSVLVTE